MHDADYQPSNVLPLPGPSDRRQAQRKLAKLNRANQLALFSSPDLVPAIEADELAYNAALLAQVSLPHRDPARRAAATTDPDQDAYRWIRSNGHLRLVMLADPEIGLPWGYIPRLVMLWLADRIVERKERTIPLNDTYTPFMREIGVIVAGGAHGRIRAFKDQVTRLFSASIQCNVVAPNGSGQRKIDVATEHELWWDPKQPDQPGLFRNYVVVSERFFEHVLEHHYPVDKRAVRLLQQSPLRLDLYMWLTYRLSYLRRPTTISWDDLRRQLGSHYGTLKHFKQAILAELREDGATLPPLRLIYPAANLRIDPAGGLELRPSRPHVPRLPKPAR
jgi:hypothetical protein